MDCDWGSEPGFFFRPKLPPPGGGVRPAHQRAGSQPAAFFSRLQTALHSKRGFLKRG